MNQAEQAFKLYTKADYQPHEEHHHAPHIVSLLNNNSQNFISNVKTEVAALVSDTNVWAVTINKKEYDNALICSPYATYIQYPRNELRKFNRLWIKSLVLLNSALMGLLCRLFKLNKVIQVNNNLNSLLKHPACFNEYLPQLTKLFIKRYPKHAIVFCRVNDTLDEVFLTHLKTQGYCVFPDRIAHVFFPESNYMKRSHTRRDMSLLRDSSYEIILHEDLTEADAQRICELYQMLFVQRHSKFNPAYTEKYFRQAIVGNWHYYSVLRNSSGRIDAFISWFKRENVMICGPLGYDIRVSQKLGLYRRLVALCLKYAHENQLIFNMGGGSDEFKSNRGSTETWEYTAVYYKHLPFYRRIPWFILSIACNKFVKKIFDESQI